MAKLIFERALRLDDEGNLQSYWPERATLKYLAKELIGSGSAFFAASYQNDPSGLEGNVLKAAWIKFYLPEDLKLAREEAKVTLGVVHSGVDPAAGGVSTDTDYCSCTSGELIANKLFLKKNYYKRLKLEHQAQAIEDWLSVEQPSFSVIEDNSSKGYVYTALTTQVNDGKGTRHPFTIEKPQGRNAVGNKMMRFLSMAPRFENGQVLVPGRITSTGQVVPDPGWEMFLEQWRNFPAGHDDTLDSTYWCVFSAFKIPQATGVTKDVAGNIVSPHMDESERIKAQQTIIRDPQGREVVPIGTPYTRRRSFSIFKGRNYER